jgi:uncharacterized protein YcnI
VRNPLPLTAAVAAAVLAAGAASAHVVADPNRGPAGAYFRTAFRVSHGCGASPTVAIRVKIPDGVLAVKPQAKPGWQATITMRKLAQAVDNGHGGQVTETVDEVAWRGGPLPGTEFDEFGLAMKLPDRPAGTLLWFPTVQECEAGVHRWIEIPAPGQRWNEVKEPAPFVRLLPPDQAD